MEEKLEATQPRLKDGGDAYGGVHTGLNEVRGTDRGHIPQGDFLGAKVTRPTIEIDDHMEVQRAPKLRKVVPEETERILTGEAWQEMARKAKAVLDSEGDPVGSLRRVADEWEQLGCSQQVLEWMREGIPILMKQAPRSQGGRRNYVKKIAMEFSNEEVSRLLFMEAIETDKFADSNEGYVFPLGAVPKPHKVDAWRLVTDITDQDRGPNAFMDKMSFKLEHVDDLLSQMGKGWYGFTFDLRAGFHHLLVREEDRKWLRFQWANQGFQFRAMPFGPRHSPFFFCKTMREFVKMLRRGCTIESCSHENCMFRAAPQGVVVVSYVDDFAVAAPTREIAQRIRDEIIGPMLKRLGLVRALDKGEWEPSTTFKFLGFQLDSVKGLVLVPQEKMDKYKQAIQKILRAGTTTPKELASVAGKMVSILRAFAPALIYVRSAFSQIAKFVDGSQGWWTPLVLSSDVKEDLAWILENLAARNGRFMWRPQRIVVVTTDAASGEKGWGATLRCDGESFRAQGRWSHIDLLNWGNAIHLLEMVGILRAVQAFRTKLGGRNVQIVTDNMICMHTLPVGSRISEIARIVKQIHDFVCNLDATIVDVAWIPTELNLVPDWLSRYQDVNDWEVNPKAWAAIVKQWPGLEIDRFTSGERNAKLGKFNTRWAMPEAPTGSDNALAQNWKGTFSYACPPLAMIGKVLSLVKEQGARAVIVCPYWEQAAWLPLLKTLTRERLCLGRGKETFVPGMSGNCAPHKNPQWVFWAVEVDGSLYPGEI